MRSAKRGQTYLSANDTTSIVTMAKNTRIMPRNTENRNMKEFFRRFEPAVTGIRVTASPNSAHLTSSPRHDREIEDFCDGLGIRFKNLPRSCHIWKGTHQQGRADRQGGEHDDRDHAADQRAAETRIASAEPCMCASASNSLLTCISATSVLIALPERRATKSAVRKGSSSSTSTRMVISLANAVRPKSRAVDRMMVIDEP